MVDFFTPELQTPGTKPMGLEEGAPSAPYAPSSAGDRLEGNIGQVTQDVLDWSKRQAAEGNIWYGNAETGEIEHNSPEPNVDPKILKQRFPNTAGLDHPMPMGVAQAMTDTQERRQKQQNLLARYPSGLGSTMLGLGADFVGGLLDPAADAAFMVPVVGEGRYAAWLARAGERAGIAGRAGVTLGVGAARGATGMGIIAGGEKVSGEDPDLSMGDVAYQTALGALQGGFFHGALSFRHDILGRRFLDQPEGQVATGNARVDDAATSAAAAQMANDQPVEVRPIFDAESTRAKLLNSTAVGQIPITDPEAASRLDDAVTRAAGQPSQRDLALDEQAKTAATTKPEAMQEAELKEAERQIAELRERGLLTQDEEGLLAGIDHEMAELDAKEKEQSVSRETDEKGKEKQEAKAEEAKPKPPPERRIPVVPGELSGPAEAREPTLGEGTAQQQPVEVPAAPVAAAEPEGPRKPEPPAGTGVVAPEHGLDQIRQTLADNHKIAVGDKEFGIKPTKSGGWTITETKEVGGRQFVVTRGRPLLGQMSRGEALDEAARQAHAYAGQIGGPIETPAPEAENIPEEGAHVGGSERLHETGGEAPAAVPPEAVRGGEEGRQPEGAGGEPGGGDRGHREPEPAEREAVGGPEPAAEGQPTERSPDVRGERRDEGNVAPGRDEPERDRPDGRVRGQNFRIEGDGPAADVTTPQARIRANLQAINLLADIGDREATAAEQQVLARFTGWGGAPQVFDERNPKFAAERERLQAALTPEQYAAARLSTINAHYTSPEIARAMWDGLLATGFDGDGSILEPGMGTGTFMGTRPIGVDPRFTGVELDDITGKIARKLYPQARIHIQSFEKTRLPESSFDAVVGNVPFADVRPNDKTYNPQRSLSLHNYFIYKSGRLLKPGGIMSIITTHYTLDAGVAAARGPCAMQALT